MSIEIQITIRNTRHRRREILSSAKDVPTVIELPLNSTTSRFSFSYFNWDNGMIRLPIAAVMGS